MPAGLTSVGFAGLTHPYRWLLVADSLHAQTQTSFHNHAGTVITQLDRDRAPTEPCPY
ncbi:hypothetical protein CA13_10630 [Planctomycetes bacterium CA13]|uniref:Uncharacterized protein n=1 Tax=Novipirellula herctigrandis TaxID=2527986 RepID=A0A5C5YYK8_9BACT|nr:hypothetical protein CA13_10630 [Planctomycetes bacterium CA13]